MAVSMATENPRGQENNIRTLAPKMQQYRLNLPNCWNWP